MLREALRGILDGLTLAAIVALIALEIVYHDAALDIITVGGCGLMLILGIAAFVTHVLGWPRTSGYRGSDGTWYGK